MPIPTTVAVLTPRTRGRHVDYERRTDQAPRVRHALPAHRDDARGVLMHIPVTGVHRGDVVGFGRRVLGVKDCGLSVELHAGAAPLQTLMGDPSATTWTFPRTTHVHVRRGVPR